MKVGILGPGHIGGNVARQAVHAGHEVILGFSRNIDTLHALAAELGGLASVGTPTQVVADADLTILSVPWRIVDEALEQAGPLDGRIVVDTTNGGAGTIPDRYATAAAFNASRMPGARYLKCFNTLTAKFQAQVVTRVDDDRVVQWIAGDDGDAVRILVPLVRDMGYAPVWLGGLDRCAAMESPRRGGTVYGEEYRLPDALTVVEAIRAGRAIEPTPNYS
jgi:8-hydroxy-5-deazaflavin:NADPH oxidoreductase